MSVNGAATMALAGEIVAAFLADEKDGGYDLTAGMFGPAFSALVRRWAAAEMAQLQATQAPITARPGWVFVTNTVSGTITATEPDGTGHTVSRGDMNTLVGHDLLNAMVRDLMKLPAPSAPAGMAPLTAESLMKLVIARGGHWPTGVSREDGLHIARAVLSAQPTSYPPLTRDEIVALTCMQGGVPWPDNYIGGLVELFALFEKLRAEGKRPVDPADMTEAEQKKHWADQGFADNGAEIEARLQHDAKHLNCSTCGGSGHAGDVKPIDMVLHCPSCGMQHIDAEEHDHPEGWDDPPHRSHLCHGCGHIWRPADVPTNGVAAVKTKGKNDSFTQPTRKPTMPRINLGDEARDAVTGFTGVCVIRSEYISGCSRVSLQPSVKADGTIPEQGLFDEPMCEVVRPARVAPMPSDRGGPGSPVPRVAAVPR